MENNETREIQYPITLSYRNHWGQWEAIREIVQNSLDSTNRLPEIYRDIDNNLVISDEGKGLEIKHLLFGMSEKTEGSRGRFGEGLKITLLVLKRLGYNIEIQSNNLCITSELFDIEGEQCLKLICKKSLSFYHGFKITIYGYIGETYQDRFINPTVTPKTLLFTHSALGQILAKDPTKNDGDLYVKDIFVCKLKGSAFSYNLKQITLEESRNMADEWSLQSEIGHIWAKCTSVAMWEDYLTAIDKKMYEAKSKLNAWSFNDTNTIRAAFESVFPNSVLFTSTEWAREAEWRNKNVVKSFDSSSFSDLYRIIETDKQFVERDANTKDIEVKESTLTDIEKRNLSLARKLVHKIDSSYGVKVFLMDNAMGKAGNPIKLAKSIIGDTDQTISTTIHELTHIYYNCDDMTGSMLHYLGDMASLLLVDYLVTEFSTKLLESKVGDYVQYRVSIPSHIAHDKFLHKGDKVLVTIRKDREID